jgi:tRNA(Ile)-lysidine synthase
LVEQRTENPCVTGSIPVVATESALQERFFYYFCCMLAKFLEHIEKNSLCKKSDKILLAVSGGVDSVVMADLFNKAGYQFCIVHCNFMLRGEESDADEKFVKELAAKKHKTKCFVRRFDTKRVVKDSRLSVQEAARDLRYNYFRKLMKKEHFDFVATAHHADDQIETFFINILRGSGISGLSGIPVKQDGIIRPLLFAFRKEIETFAQENDLEYRTDSSNKGNKYRRNKIRNKLLPTLEKISPHYRNTIITTIGNLKNTEEIYRILLREKTILKKNKKGQVCISVDDLKIHAHTSFYLYEYISPMGFNRSVCEDICNSLEAISGKVFLSPTHRLVKDRNSLIIEERNTVGHRQEYSLDRNVSKISNPLPLKISVKKMTKIPAFSPESSVAMLDMDKLVFPLTIRRWKQGDYFYPLGLKGRKKLSDFFSDQKFSIIDKQNTWLLCSENKIVWVIGWRIDDRFKITKETKNSYRIKNLETIN